MGNILADKPKIPGRGVIRAGEGVIQTGKGTIRAGQETKKYYENKSKFNGVYSRNKLPKINDGAYITNIHEYESIGIHSIAVYANGDNVIYSDSFGVKCIPKKIENFIGNKNVIKNIYKIQANILLC